MGWRWYLFRRGCFQMGDVDGYSDEKPVHEVCFDQPFWFDKMEVNNRQFARFGGAASSTSDWTELDRPREQITWLEAREFCALRDARLPTEAEWEYAARGPESLVYPWGNGFLPGSVVYGGNSDDQTAPVGSIPAGVSWVGALDLSGNVAEWTADWYSETYYASTPASAPSGPPSGQYRVVRGGSWNANPFAMRAAMRDWNLPDFRNKNIGFRCARSS